MAYVKWATLKLPFRRSGSTDLDRQTSSGRRIGVTEGEINPSSVISSRVICKPPRPQRTGLPSRGWHLHTWPAGDPRSSLHFRTEGSRAVWMSGAGSAWLTNEDEWMQEKRLTGERIKMSKVWWFVWLIRVRSSFAPVREASSVCCWGDWFLGKDESETVNGSDGVTRWFVQDDWNFLIILQTFFVGDFPLL